MLMGFSNNIFTVMFDLFSVIWNFAVYAKLAKFCIKYMQVRYISMQNLGHNIAGIAMWDKETTAL